jgi:predicted MPP superfamily phosphohydrolase
MNMKKILIGMAAIVILLSATFAAYGETTLSKNLPSQEIVSYAGFSEIDPARNHFILIGDTQATSHWEFWRERNDQERKLILEEIEMRQPAFVVHLGDLTVRGSSKKHWQEFDDLHKAWHEKKIPCFPILGNHEFYGNNQRSLDYYFGRFPYLEHRRWYSFTWKGLGLILLDSNFSTLSAEEKDRQKRWYFNELERFENNKEIDSVIVCCHEPPFTNSRVVGPNKQVKDDFANPFLRFRKTSFFFSGHAHTYERFELEGKSFIVSGGGGGPRHKVNNDPVRRRYPDLFLGPELRFFHACEIERNDTALIYKVLRLEPDRTFSVIDPIIVNLSHR